MIPKVAGKGSSFKGAAQYYLHDKGASTAERVAFAETVNLPTRDPDKAFKCMAWTAEHQNEIKEAAGGSKRGRKLQDPVYTYSLAWAPDEKPTKEQMIGAAMETLSVLGLTENEAILVAHRDEPHPHIHVIVNRVHPQTGIAAKLSNDHLKLSRWAEDYEKRQGQIRCEERVENNKRRDRGEWVKDSRDYRAGDFYRWRRQQRDAAAARRGQEREDLSEGQRRRRDELEQDWKTRRHEAFREATRSRWRMTYQQFEKERYNLTYELDTAQRRLDRLIGRDAKRALRFEREHRTGFLSRVHKSAQERHGKLAALDEDQRKRRVKLAERFKAARFEAVEEIDRQYERDLEELKETERREREELQTRQSKESQQQASRIKEGSDYQDYREERRQKRRERFQQLKDELTQPRPGSATAKRNETARNFRDNADDVSQDRDADRGRDDDRGRSRGRKPPDER